MANLNISGYTFSTTSVPTSPALKVVSGTDTIYVNLTNASRPAALSGQKVFTLSSNTSMSLRPYVTSNSLTGYTGVSNNSTATTGYTGVSNNSTTTTGYAGYSSSRLNGAVNDWYGGTTYINSFAPSADYFNQISLSGMTNWTTTSTLAQTGSHSIPQTITTRYTGYTSSSLLGTGSRSSTVLNDLLTYTTYMNGYHVSNMNNWVTSKTDERPTQGTYSKNTTVPASSTSPTTSTIFSVSSSRHVSRGIEMWTYTYDSRYLYRVVFNASSKTYGFIDPDACFDKASNTTFGTTYATTTAGPNDPQMGGTMTFYNYGFGGYTYTFQVSAGSTTYSNGPASHGGPIGECHITASVANAVPVISYSVSYIMTNTYLAELALGWYHLQSWRLRTSGYRPIHGYGYRVSSGGTYSFYYRTESLAGTSLSTFLNNVNTAVAFSKTTTGGIVTWASNTTTPGTTYWTNYTATYSASSGNTYLTTQDVYYGLSSYTALTTTQSKSQQHYSLYASNTASSGNTYYSTSGGKGYMSSITDLTNTTTRYSSSTAKGYMSNVTDLTKTTTRFTSSTGQGNMSSMTELRTITRI